MTLDRTRIATWTLVLASLGALAVATIVWRVSQTTFDPYDAWIPLPRNAMDAADPNVREALEVLAVLEGNAYTLAHRCGRVGDAGPAERYQLAIGDSPLTLHGEAWHVDIQVEGESARISTRHLGYRRVPPMRPAHLLPVVEVVRPLSTLEPVRAAWRDPVLWDRPQGPVGCRHGRTMTLQACIHGRYTLRMRDCDSGDAGAKLWEVVQATLPPPRLN